MKTNRRKAKRQNRSLLDEIFIPAFFSPPVCISVVSHSEGDEMQSWWKWNINVKIFFFQQFFVAWLLERLPVWKRETHGWRVAFTFLRVIDSCNALALRSRWLTERGSRLESELSGWHFTINLLCETFCLESLTHNFVLLKHVDTLCFFCRTCSFFHPSLCIRMSLGYPAFRFNCLWHLAGVLVVWDMSLPRHIFEAWLVSFSQDPCFISCFTALFPFGGIIYFFSSFPVFSILLLWLCSVWFLCSNYVWFLVFRK